MGMFVLEVVCEPAQGFDNIVNRASLQAYLYRTWRDSSGRCDWWSTGQPIRGWYVLSIIHSLVLSTPGAVQATGRTHAGCCWLWLFRRFSNLFTTWINAYINFELTHFCCCEPCVMRRNNVYVLNFRLFTCVTLKICLMWRVRDEGEHAKHRSHQTSENVDETHKTRWSVQLLYVTEIV